MALSVFRNPAFNQEIINKGFLLLDAGIEKEATQLRDYIASNHRISQSHFSYSLIENFYEQNKRIRAHFKEMLYNFFEDHFTNYKSFNESFLVKPAHSSEELLLHQDFCYTDEEQFSVYNLWIPLNDVSEQNGAMFVLPGSHAWFENFRSASLPTARISMNKFPAGQIKKVEMKRGQALLFHPAVFHGSYPNNTGENRIIVTATIAQKDAPFLYFHQEENSIETEVYQLDDDAFLRDLGKISMKARPAAPLIKRFDYRHRILTEQELIAKASEFAYDQ